MKTKNCLLIFTDAHEAVDMNCSPPGDTGGGAGGGASIFTDAVETTTAEISKLTACSVTVISSDDVPLRSFDNIEVVSSKVIASTVNSTFTVLTNAERFRRRFINDAGTSVTFVIVIACGDTFKYVATPSLKCSC